MNRDLKVGDTVTLSPDHTWTNNLCNMVGILGVVIENKFDGPYVYIKWGHKNHNAYRDTDSDLIKVEVNP